MPFFKLREKIRLQDRPNHFIWLGPGIVEVDDTVAQHGFLNLVGERIPDLRSDGDTDQNNLPVQTFERPVPTANDLNPKKKQTDPKIAEAPIKVPPAPLKAFGEGPKSLQQKQAEAEARALLQAQKPEEDKVNNLVSTLPVKPVDNDSSSIPETIKSDPISAPGPLPESATTESKSETTSAVDVPKSSNKKA